MRIEKLEGKGGNRSDWRENDEHRKRKVTRRRPGTRERGIRPILWTCPPTMNQELMMRILC